MRRLHARTMVLERVERRQNHWHSIHRRYGLPKHLSGSTIERCATQFLIWLRPWRENRLLSDMARLADVKRRQRGRAPKDLTPSVIGTAC